MRESGAEEGRPGLQLQGLPSNGQRQIDLREIRHTQALKKLPPGDKATEGEEGAGRKVPIRCRPK